MNADFAISGNEQPTHATIVTIPDMFLVPAVLKFALRSVGKRVQKVEETYPRDHFIPTPQKGPLYLHQLTTLCVVVVQEDPRKHTYPNTSSYHSYLEAYQQIGRTLTMSNFQYFF